jgi:hypothetical protein
VKRVFESHLRKGETVLWTGFPSTSLLWRRRERNIWLSGAIFATIASVEVVHLARDVGCPAAILAIPVIFFILPTSYFACGHPIQARRIRSKTTYAITNQRVLILVRWSRERLTEYSLAHVKECTVEPETKELSTVAFGWRPSASDPNHSGALIAWPGRVRPAWPEFVGLAHADADTALKVLNEARAMCQPRTKWRQERAQLSESAKHD